MKKKLTLNESKQKLFEMMGALGQEYVQEAETPEGIVGKTVVQAFPQMEDKLWGIKDKQIQYAKFFPSRGTFTAVGDAEKYLKNEGYTKGSMYMDYPIGFIKNGKFGVDTSSYEVADSAGNISTKTMNSTLMPTKHGEQRPMSITKWDRLGPEQHDMLDGVILSEDFREGDCYVVFFVFPE